MGVVIRKSFNASIFHFLGVGIGAFSVLFIQTKLLNEQEIGALKTFNALAMLIYPFVLFGLSNAVSKFYFEFEKKKEHFNSLITLLLLFPLVLILLLFFLLFGFQNEIYTTYLETSQYLKTFVIVVPLMVFYQAYSSIFESYLATQKKIIIPTFLRNIALRMYLILLVGIYFIEYINFNTLLIVFSILHLFNVLLLSYYFFKALPFPFQFTFQLKKTLVYSKFINYCIYMILTAGSAVIVAQIDTIMTGSILKNLGDVGIYTVAFFIGTVIEIPKRPLSQLLVPIISKSLEEQNIEVTNSLYKKSSINLFLIGSLIFGLIWINIDDLFAIIPNGEIYSTGKYVVLFIGISKLFDLFTGMNAEIIHYSKLYKWNLFLTPFLALVSIGTNFYFIKNYGITGTAIATVISISLYNVIRTTLVYVKLGIQPFSKSHITIVFFLLAGIGISALITCVTNPYISIPLKGMVFTTILLLPAYFFKVSSDLNDAFIRKIKLY